MTEHVCIMHRLVKETSYACDNVATGTKILKLYVKKTIHLKMWYTYTIEYYSAIKRNEIMPFAATWMDLECVILSEVRQRREISYDTHYIWTLKRNDINELIYKTEIDSDFENELRVAGGRDGGRDS